MKPRYHPYSRAYRRLIAKLGLSEEERRDLTFAVTGKFSTTALDKPAWLKLLAEVSRLAGEPSPEHYRRSSRGTRHAALPYPLDNCATPEQQAYIADLRGKIAWDHEDGPAVGFRHFAASVLFRGGRDEVVARAWIDHNASLATLTPSQASLLIRALRRSAAAAPACRSAAASVQSV